MSAIQLWALEDFCACWPLNVCVLTGGLFLTFPVRYGAAKGSGLLMIKLPFTFDLSRPSAWHYKCRWPFAWSSLPLAVRDSARMNLLMAVEDLQGEKAWISCFASPFGFLFGGAFSCSLHLDKTVPVLGGGWAWGWERRPASSSPFLTFLNHGHHSSSFSNAAGINELSSVRAVPSCWCQ